MLHLAQIGFFKPIVDKVAAAGGYNDSLFRSSGLSRFQLEESSNYVPSASICSFLDKTERLHRPKGLLETFGAAISLDNIPDFTSLIADAPDLLTACQKAASNNDIIFTNEKAVFYIDGTQTTFGSCFYDNHIAGHKHIEGLNLALMINGFRELVGPDWRPLVIRVQQAAIQGFEALLPNNNTTRVYFNQPCTSVTFPTEQLSRPLAIHRLRPDADSLKGHRAASLALRIHRLLDANREEHIPNLEDFAALAHMHSRTIQRKLADEGTSFSGIVDRWRFKKVLHLLSDPTMRVKDIHRKVGYTDVSNFERAFRRWTHTSPGKYRNRLVS